MVATAADAVAIDPAALGNIAPNIGSIVAIEKDKERRPNQAFPTFLALNSNAAAGPGYLPAVYAPFKVTPSTNGIEPVASGFWGLSPSPFT